jgi:hypothetical protein
MVAFRALCTGFFRKLNVKLGGEQTKWRATPRTMPASMEPSLLPAVHEIVFGLEFKGASSQLAKALAWMNQNEQITPTATRKPQSSEPSRENKARFSNCRIV